MSIELTEVIGRISRHWSQREILSTDLAVLASFGVEAVEPLISDFRSHNQQSVPVYRAMCELYGTLKEESSGKPQLLKEILLGGIQDSRVDHICEIAKGFLQKQEVTSRDLISVVMEIVIENCGSRQFIWTRLEERIGQIVERNPEVDFSDMHAAFEAYSNVVYKSDHSVLFKVLCGLGKLLEPLESSIFERLGAIDWPTRKDHGLITLAGFVGGERIVAKLETILNALPIPDPQGGDRMPRLNVICALARAGAWKAKYLEIMTDNFQQWDIDLSGKIAQIAGPKIVRLLMQRIVYVEKYEYRCVGLLERIANSLRAPHKFPAEDSRRALRSWIPELLRMIHMKEEWPAGVAIDLLAEILLPSEFLELVLGNWPTAFLEEESEWRDRFVGREHELTSLSTEAIGRCLPALIAKRVRRHPDMLPILAERGRAASELYRAAIIRGIDLAEFPSVEAYERTAATDALRQLAEDEVMSNAGLACIAILTKINNVCDPAAAAALTKLGAILTTSGEDPLLQAALRGRINCFGSSTKPWIPAELHAAPVYPIDLSD